MVLKEAENKDVENWLVKPYELLPRVGILRSCDNCEKTFDSNVYFLLKNT